MAHGSGREGQVGHKGVPQGSIGFAYGLIGHRRIWDMLLAPLPPPSPLSLPSGCAMEPAEQSGWLTELAVIGTISILGTLGTMKAMGKQLRIQQAQSRVTFPQG